MIKKLVACSLVVLFVCSGCVRKLLPTKILPYSMVQYQAQKFVDETEITVEDWAEFVFDGHEDHKPNEEISNQFSYHEIFYPNEEPDSLFRAFGKIDYYQLPVVTTYFDTLTYQELRQILDFPITGITYEDAVAYTTWRTKKYNGSQTDHTKKTIQFLLPTSIVFTVDTIELTHKDLMNAPLKTKTKQANKFAVFGLHDNVAEMTITKGIAFGQTKKGNKVIPTNQIPYKGPEPWLGFRCIGLVVD